MKSTGIRSLGAAVALLAGIVIAVSVEARVLGEMATRIGVKRLATGPEADHTCFIMADGTVRCWGNNSTGQLGVAGATGLTPVTPPGISNAVSIAVGKLHTCVLTASGSVVCWGSNLRGQLGIPTSTRFTATPTAVPNVARATAIAAGSLHTCARIADGTVTCWGANDVGQLGDGTFLQLRPTPAAVTGMVDAVTVTAGADHTCALRAGGILSCWGSNAFGQLAIPLFSNQPQPLPAAGINRVLEVSGGKSFSCAIAIAPELLPSTLVSNSAFCWGLDEAGAFLLQFHHFTSTPNPVRSFIRANDVQPTHLESLSTGGAHACAVRSRDQPSVVCWGDNSSGQIGIGLVSATDFGRSVAIGLEVVAGRAHTCIVDTADGVKCWGANDLGQLGNGTTNPLSALPDFPILVGGISARSVAVSDGATGLVAGPGPGHSCAGRADGTASCWGANDVGQLNDSTTADRRLPTATKLALPVIALFAGTQHTCAGANGGIACWGSNEFKQSRIATAAGTTPITTNVSQTETSLRGGGTAGSFHTCALEMADESHCWGNNASGELGIGPSPSAGPSDLRIVNAIAAAAGSSHTCLLSVVGTVSCGGKNDKGQLGIGSFLAIDGVFPVSGLSGVIAISASGDHTCALLFNGRVACWGDNANGQVDGSTAANRPFPVQVPGVAAGDAAGIAVGGGHTCILGSTGIVRCWGANARGQLGDTTTTNRASLVTVQRFQPIIINGVSISFLQLDNVVGVAAGGNHNCVVRTNGAPVCWGGNARGQLGDNTLIDRPYGVSPASFTANIGKTAALDENERKLTVTALLNCQEGARFFVEVTVDQGGVHGRGQATGDCTGGLNGYPLKIEAHGRGGFALGAAQGSAQIAVRDHRSAYRRANVDAGNHDRRGAARRARRRGQAPERLTCRRADQSPRTAVTGGRGALARTPDGHERTIAHLRGAAHSRSPVDGDLSACLTNRCVEIDRAGLRAWVGRARNPCRYRYLHVRIEAIEPCTAHFVLYKRCGIRWVPAWRHQQ